MELDQVSTWVVENFHLGDVRRSRALAELAWGLMQADTVSYAAIGRVRSDRRGIAMTRFATWVAGALIAAGRLALCLAAILLPAPAPWAVLLLVPLAGLLELADEWRERRLRLPPAVACPALAPATDRIEATCGRSLDRAACPTCGRDMADPVTWCARCDTQPPAGGRRGELIATAAGPPAPR